VLLSDKRKKRIKDIAIIIKNSKKMSIEMNTINEEYELELLEVVESILSLSQPPEKKESKKALKKRPIRNNKPFRSKLFKKGLIPFEKPTLTNSENKQATIEEHVSAKKNMPDWCKDLWRKIMMSCHPDKLLHMKDLTNSDILERSEIIEKASESIEKESWEELIYLAALVDSYTEKLKYNQQINRLNKINNVNSKLILDIQNSIPWHWGGSWDFPDKRLKILKHVLKSKNIPIPPDRTLNKIINDLE